MLKKYKTLFLILLSYIVVLSFYPAITSDFINLDDTVMVTENPDITNLSFNNVKHIFSSFQYKLYHPIVTLSYAIEYSICRLDPFLYHVDNLLLHLINTFFVFLIIQILSKSFFVGFVTALIFALHPVHVEPVIWVTARKDTLFTFFFLLSILSYIEIDKIKYKKFFYILSLFYFLLSCMSKPTAITLPFIIILIDYYRNELKFKINNLKRYIPFFIISIAFIYIAISGHYSEEEKAITTIFVRCVDFFDAHFHMLFYIYKFFIPINLSCVYPSFYDHNDIMPDFIFYSTTILYLLFLFVLLSLKINKKIFFGFFFFIITLLPSSGILATGISPVADRYCYIPYIGLAFIIAEIIFYLYKKSNISKYIALFIIIIIGSVLALLSYQRSLLWADNEKLMEQAINYAPEKAFQAYLLRGMIYKLNEQLDLAEKDLLKSFSINEKDSYTVFHLGHLKQLQKDYKSAEEYYAYIPFTNVNYVAVVNNMGIILDIEGKTKDAIDFMEREKEKNIFVVPDYFFNTLAIFYYKEKNIDKAIENMKKTINLNPYNEHYYTQLMNLYKEKGNFIDFEYIALIGMKNIDDNISILNELISYYFSIEQYDKVEEVFLKYFKSNNDVGYSLLGNICAIKNNYKDALTCYTMAILLSRDKGLYYFKRAVVWYMLNNYNQAKKNVEKAEKYKFVVNDEFKQDLEKIK